MSKKIPHPGRRPIRQVVLVNVRVAAHGVGKGRVAWYVGPTCRQSKEIVWRDIKELARKWIVGKPNETDLSFDLLAGGRIAIRGANNPDSLRGPGLNGLVMDELADIHPSAWDTVLRPMLADRKGSALFIGTPKGRNHFYEMYTKAPELAGWSRFQFTTLDGGRVDAQEIEDAKHSMDERSFRQEFLATFESYAGLAYYNFQRELNVKPITYNPRLPLLWALDFNVDPMSSVICQIEEYGDVIQGRRRVLHVLEEIFLRNSNTGDACEQFEKRVSKWYQHGRQMEVYIYGDASGANRKTTGPSDYNLLKQWMATRPHFRTHYRVPLENPLVKNRVNAVNSLTCSFTGERALFIHPGCKELIKDFEQVEWERVAGGSLTGEQGRRQDADAPERCARVSGP